MKVFLILFTFFTMSLGFAEVKSEKNLNRSNCCPICPVEASTSCKRLEGVMRGPIVLSAPIRSGSAAEAK